MRGAMAMMVFVGLAGCGGGGTPHYVAVDSGMGQGSSDMAGLGMGGDMAGGLSHHDGAGGSVPNTLVVYGLKAGAGAEVPAGTGAAFLITGNVGGAFRITWSDDKYSGGMPHELYGSIYTAGTFSGVAAGCQGSCALGARDFVSDPRLTQGGQRIDLDGLGGTAIAGVDFTVDSMPVYLHLFIDGAHIPDHVLFTSSATGMLATAGEIPFGLTIQN